MFISDPEPRLAAAGSIVPPEILNCSQRAPSSMGISISGGGAAQDGPQNEDDIWQGQCTEFSLHHYQFKRMLANFVDFRIVRITAGLGNTGTFKEES